MNNLVSILVPVYNRANIIAEVLDSALMQDYDDVEIIVCDNCSEDDTFQRVNDIANRYPKIRVLRNDTNIGPVLNWERCVRDAKGEYIKILFSDDLLGRDSVSKMVQCLQSTQSVVCVSRVEIGSSLDSAQIMYEPDFSVRDVYSFLADLIRPGGAPVSPCAYLFRRDALLAAFEQVKSVPLIFKDGYSHGGGIDLLLIALVVYSAKGVVADKSAITFFRSHPGSISVQQHSKMLARYSDSILAFCQMKEVTPLTSVGAHHSAVLIWRGFCEINDRKKLIEAWRVGLWRVFEFGVLYTLKCFIIIAAREMYWNVNRVFRKKDQ